MVINGRREKKKKTEAVDVCKWALRHATRARPTIFQITFRSSQVKNPRCRTIL